MSAIALDPVIAAAKHRARRRRLYVVTVLAAAVAVGGALFWRYSGGSSELAHYSNPSFSFRYPAEWKQIYCPEESSHSNSFTFLTNAPSAVCPTYPKNESWYQPPISRLGVDGVLVEWWTLDPLSATSLAGVPGRRATLGGFPARVQTVPTRGPTWAWACRAVGGVGKLVWIDERGNWIMVTGCFRGPNLTANETAFRRMLTSVRFAKNQRLLGP